MTTLIDGLPPVCPERPDVYDTLEEYIFEKVSPERKADMEEHLKSCTICREELGTTFGFTGAARIFFEKNPDYR